MQSLNWIELQATPLNFKFLNTLEENWKVVLDELDNLLYNEAVNGKSYFKSLDDGWETFDLFFAGNKKKENCEKCPNTVKLVESSPLLVSAYICALAPESCVSPHVAPNSTVCRYHLGLIVPPPIEVDRGSPTLLSTCGMKMGDEYHTWVPGKAFQLAPAKPYIAWNMGDRTRFILVVDHFRA